MCNASSWALAEMCVCASISNININRPTDETGTELCSKSSQNDNNWPANYPTLGQYIHCLYPLYCQASSPSASHGFVVRFLFVNGFLVLYFRCGEVWWRRAKGLAAMKSFTVCRQAGSPPHTQISWKCLLSSGLGRLPSSARTAPLPSPHRVYCQCVRDAVVKKLALTVYCYPPCCLPVRMRKRARVA